MNPQPYVVVQGWFGSRRLPVEVIGRTAKRVRVRFLADSGGRRRGDVRLVAPDVVRWPTGGAR